MKTRLLIKSFLLASLAIVLMQGCSKDEDKSVSDGWSVRPSFTTLDTRPESVIAMHKVTELQAEPVELNTLKTRGKYALVIGISDYEGYQYDLSYCDDDAEDWADLLEGEGYTVTRLIDRNATRSAIQSAVSNLVSLSSAGNEIAFCYSGHGGGGNIISTDLYYIGSGYLGTMFSYATSTKMMFSFDACEIGAMKNALNATGRIVTVASSSNTYSYDGDYTMRNGVFTYYQMEGFEDLGYTCVEDDSEYAIDKMKEWAWEAGVDVGPSYVDSYYGCFDL